MKMKCRIDCQAVNCEKCLLRQEDIMKDANRLIELEKEHVAELNNRDIAGRMAELTAQICVNNELLSFYKSVLRERGALPKEEKPAVRVDVGAYSC